MLNRLSKLALSLFVLANISLAAQESETTNDTAIVIPRTNIKDTSAFSFKNFEPINTIRGINLSAGAKLARHDMATFASVQGMYVGPTLQLRGSIQYDVLSDVFSYGNSNLTNPLVHDNKLRNSMSFEFLVSHNFPEVRTVKPKFVTFSQYDPTTFRPYYFTVNQSIDISRAFEFGITETNSLYRFSNRGIQGRLDGDPHVRDLVDVLDVYQDAYTRYHAQSLVFGWSRTEKINSLLNAAGYGMVTEAKIRRMYAHALVLVNSQIADIHGVDPNNADNTIWTIHLDQYIQRSIVGLRAGYEVNQLGVSSTTGYNFEIGTIPGPVSEYIGSQALVEMANNFYIKAGLIFSLNKFEIN